MTEIKNVIKVFETSERVMWEEEIPCHQDDTHTYIHTYVPIALVPKWHTKRNFLTHNFILRSTIFPSEGASHLKSRAAKKFYPPSLRYRLY
jgi:hypothetical protein